jgi:hypothetical protein
VQEGSHPGSVPEYQEASIDQSHPNVSRSDEVSEGIRRSDLLDSQSEVQYDRIGI